MAILLSLMRKPPYGYSAEYADNRISLLNGENVLLPVKNSQVHMRFTVITNCPGILEAMIPMGILF